MEHGFGAFVDACTVEGAIDESDGLAAFECEELVGVAFDFCFGDFEDCSDDLIAIFLCERSISTESKKQGSHTFEQENGTYA